MDLVCSWIIVEFSLSESQVSHCLEVIMDISQKHSIIVLLVLVILHTIGDCFFSLLNLKNSNVDRQVCFHFMVLSRNWGSYSKYNDL